MKNTPFYLIYSRIVFALLILSQVFYQIDGFEWYIAVFMVLGLLSDVFDGIIARKLNVSSEKLRIWDSNVDQFFWVTVIFAVFYLRFPMIKPLLLPISILLLFEVSTYLVSYFKFRKTIATHSILAKLWTISLLVFLLELTLNSSTLSFYFCFILGLISRIEILLIIVKLDKWTTDVPSIFSVHKLNKGIPIKKNKYFNG
jgi:CDP-diacylglycerol--glycerol-3-phosphate 3-phosphatidyltransferase